MAYVDLSTIHDPAAGSAPPASWGDQIRDNFEALPRGEVAYAQATSNQSGISSVTDLTSLSVTFTAVAGRRYRIHASARMTQSSNAAVPELYVTDGSNAIQNRRGISLGNGDTAAFDVVAFVEPGGGSVTYKARATTGAGTVGLVAAADLKAFIQVEDIGPA